MLHRFFDSVWGSATELLAAPMRRRRWVDLLALAAVAGVFAALVFALRQWTAPARAIVDIDLGLLALPKYALFSLVRALSAYALSLGFTLVVAYWAARNALAERILIPILDILQSLPLLAFMPAVLLTMMTLFPRSNVGLELSAVVLIFTSQAWNMAFSFYQSLKTLPKEMEETSALFGFTWMEKLRLVELPFAIPGLVWNSMVSVANGWFFLMASEAFKLGERDFRLPGLGSYVSVAVDRGDATAQVLAIATMLLIVIALDRLVWKPVVAWSQRFQVDEALPVEKPRSVLLQIFRRSRLFRWLEYRRSQRLLRRRPPRNPFLEKAREELRRPGRWSGWMATGGLLAVLAALGVAGLSLLRLLVHVHGREWATLLAAGGASLGRVLLSTALSTLWTVPVGLAIGLSPRLSKRFQPVVQVVASFPATILFPSLLMLLAGAGIRLNWSSVFLMMMGTQWYLLFNIIAGAQAVPMDLRETAEAYRMGLFRRLRSLYLPAIFPYLVTGWVTATGGAWNASIVAEIAQIRGHAHVAFGLGAQVALATDARNMPLLAASALLMAALVVLFNRLVWAPLYRLAEERFALNR
jgi:NitT/TauT family transport system permease protein